MKQKLRLMMTMLLLAVMGTTWADTYKKVTSSTEIIAGKQYVLVCESKSLAMKVYVSGTKCDAVDVTINNNTVSSVDNINVLTLEEGDGGYYFKQSDNKYLYSSGAKNLKADAQNKTLCTISDEFEIVMGSSGTLQYNSSSPRFCPYTSSQTPAYLYVLDENSTPATYTVTYDCNEGTSGCPEDLTGVEAGTVITLADAPTKTDYTFGGWSNGTNIYQPGDEYTVNGNVTFTAQWTSAIDYVTLPYNWEGGSSSALTEVNGITAEGLGSDYAESNAPYLVKFDSTGDYILIKTNERPGKVTIDVKMLGGANSSMITVQGSQDGVTFTDVQTLTISGTQNSVLTLETTNVFEENDRYVKLLFTRGSNVGVGPFSIAVYTESEPVDPEVSFEEETITLKVGKFYTNPINKPSNLTVIYSVTDGSEYASVNTSTGVVTGLAIGQATITASWEAVGNLYNAGSKSYTVNVIENVVEEFEKVLNVAKLYDGLEIIIVNEAAQKTMGAQGGNNFGATRVELDLESNPYVTILPDGATVLTLKKGEDNTWYFLTPDNKYLYAASSNNNYLKTTDSQNDNAKAKIVIGDDGDAEIIFQGSYTRNTIMYNSSNDLFSCYASGQNPVQIYSNKTFEKVSFGTAGYKTYVTANAIDWRKTLAREKDVHGYQVTAFSTSVVELTELGNDMITAAETPVILKGVKGKNLLVIADGEGSDISLTNLLKRGSENKNYTNNIYVLQKSQDPKWSEDNPYENYKFYPLNTSRYSEIGDRQAFLVLSFAPGANEVVDPGVSGYKGIPMRFVKANDDDPMVSDDAGIIDGINGVENTGVNGEFYSISGVRVAAPTKGLYIVNGKKVLVK